MQISDLSNQKLIVERVSQLIKENFKEMSPVELIFWWFFLRDFYSEELVLCFNADEYDFKLLMAVRQCEPLPDGVTAENMGEEKRAAWVQLIKTLLTLNSL